MAQVVIAVKFWSITWDDSAITLGFAQTLAHTGRIAPTPGSTIVEGYSTTLWMLLMTIAAGVLSSPGLLLVVAKVSTLLLNLVSLFMIRYWFRDWLGELTASLIAGAMGCCFMLYETINGMETPLLLGLVFAMLLVRRYQTRGAWWGYLILGLALLLVRFEAAWLLAPFVLTERMPRDRVASAATWLSAFLLQGALRWWYFGALLPNTILAKRRFPYTVGTPKHQLVQHLLQIPGLGQACWSFVLVTAIYLISCLWARRERHLGSRAIAFWGRCRQLRFVTVFLIFSMVLTVAIGPNWGPPLRSFYAGWPFLMALVLWPLGWREIRGRGRTLTVAVLAVCFLCVIKMAHKVNEMRSPNAPLYMPNATVDHVRLVSDVLGSIQSASGQQDILFAGPDMGGVQLYSRGIRVLDLGLLCDSTLAREGYGVVEKYVFEERRPDVILVHDIWTSLVNPGKSERFLTDYRPVVVNGTRVFLRRELLAQIDPRRLASRTFTNGMMVEERNTSSPQAEVDRVLNEQFLSYWVLH